MAFRICSPLNHIKPCSVLIGLLLCCPWSLVRAQTNPNQTAMAKRCADEKRVAFKQGYDSAWDEFIQSSYVTRVAGGGKPLSIRLVVEKFDGADSYRYAAAEVVRANFSEWLTVSPKSDLELYITGTQWIPLAPAREGQNVEIEMKTYGRRLFVTGTNENHSPVGAFIISREREFFQNYTGEERVQAVKELVYKVISDFLKKWQEIPTTK